MMKKVLFTALLGSACLSNHAFAKRAASTLRNLQETDIESSVVEVEIEAAAAPEAILIADPIFHTTAMRAPAEEDNVDSVDNGEYTEMYTMDYVAPAPLADDDEEMGFAVEMEPVYDEAEPEVEPVMEPTAVAEEDEDDDEENNAEGEMTYVEYLQMLDNTNPPEDVDYDSDYDDEPVDVDYDMDNDEDESEEDSDEEVKPVYVPAKSDKDSDNDEESDSDIVVNVPNPKGSDKDEDSDSDIVVYVPNPKGSDKDEDSDSDIVVQVPNPKDTDKGKKKKHSAAWYLRCRPNN